MSGSFPGIKIRLFPEFEPVDTVVFAFRNQFFNTRFCYGRTIAELTAILSNRVRVEIHVTDSDKKFLDNEMIKAGVKEDSYVRIETCPSECILNSFMPIFGNDSEGQIVGITFPFLQSDERYAKDFKQCEEYAESYLANRGIRDIRLPFEFGAARVVANEKIALISNCHETREAKSWFAAHVAQQCFFVPYLNTEPTKDLDVFILPLKENKWLLTEFENGRKERETVDFVLQLLKDQKQEVLFIPGLKRVKHDDVDYLPNYTNCIVVNKTAIVPKYGREEDGAVAAILKDFGYTVYAVAAQKISESNAGFHCISKTIPSR